MHDNFSSRQQWSKRTPALLCGLASSLAASMPAGVAIAAPATGAHATAKTDQAIARTLAQKPASGWSSVILKTAGALAPAQEARLRSLGADITHRLPLIQSVALRLPTRNLGRLAALPFVAHLSEDGRVTKSDEFTVGSSEAAGVYANDASGNPYLLTGLGVTVAVLDSGIHQSSQDLQYAPGGPGQKAPKGQRLLASVNYVATAPTGGMPADDPCGHGTHVAGIIGGNGQASSTKHCFRTFYGIAPQSSLISIRVLDQTGAASVSNVITGLQWAVANQSKYNIRILNLSLGHPVGESYTTDPLCQAVEAAWKAGIVVVCAAGNEGRVSTTNTLGASNEGWGTAYGSIQSPANDPDVITVGATKQNILSSGAADTNRAHDKIATYSSRGPSRLDLVLKPDIIAPGNRVISVDVNNSYLDNYAGGSNDIPQALYQTMKDPTVVSDTYFRLSGTSMAAPVVAGAAALLLQADPTLTPDTIKARLMLSADKWAAPDGTQDALTYGAGYLNIPAALACTATATLPAHSPTLTANSDGSLSLIMDRAAWGSSATSGSGLWGTGVSDLRAAWGSAFTPAGVAGSGAATAADRAAWGSNSIASSRAAWGSSVWGDRAAWGCDTSAVDLSATAITGDPVYVATHLLWNNTDGRVMLWHVASDGTFTLNGFGPYTDGAPQNKWTATALATGADGKSHILWNNTDGRVMLWTVDDAGNFTLAGYGPYTDDSVGNDPSINKWHATAVSVGPDNTVHLLWNNTDHRVMLWNVAQDFSFTLAGYGPYTDTSVSNDPGNLWSATALATGPDNKSRIVWNNADGRVMLWNVDSAFNFSLAGYGPYTDNAPNNLWSATGVSVGPDKVTHILWANTDKRAMLWNVDSSFHFTLAGFGPYTDNAAQNLWSATAVATGSDGLSHILWDNTDNRAMLWGVDSAFNFAVTGYGPYTDNAPQNLWSATAVSAGP